MVLFLRVTVIEARGFKLPFGTLSSDVYVVICSAAQRDTTNIQRAFESMAVWDEVFDFELLQGWKHRQPLVVCITHICTFTAVITLFSLNTSHKSVWFNTISKSCLLLKFCEQCRHDCLSVSSWISNCLYSNLWEMVCVFRCNFFTEVPSPSVRSEHCTFHCMWWLNIKTCECAASSILSK